MSLFQGLNRMLKADKHFVPIATLKFEETFCAQILDEVSFPCLVKARQITNNSVPANFKLQIEQLKSTLERGY